VLHLTRNVLIASNHFLHVIQALDITLKSARGLFQKAGTDIPEAFRERKKEAVRWEKIKILNSIKTKIAALDIVKELQNGQNMRDLMRKTSLVMMAEPEEFAEKEKGKNLVRSKVTTNSIVGLSYNTPSTEIYHGEFHQLI
jgi:hypothetical protein